MAKLTPMMEQYMQIKKDYTHCILFFRLGDFYEMFYDDAFIASRELDIALTGKNCGQEERAPMCGVPFHSADSYISKLVSKGYNVAVCEQMEDPSLAKGIVKREVIRVITPGTQLDSTVLDEKKNNYLLCIFGNKNGFGMSICDVTTGELETTELSSVNAKNKLIDEVGKFQPAEIICNEELKNNSVFAEIEKKFDIKCSVCEKWMFDYTSSVKILCEHFHVHSLDGFGLREQKFSICACGGLLQYLYETQKNELQHICNIKFYTVTDFMFLDVSSRRNLGLTETMREKAKKGSLLWVLDKTKTSMGARLLRKWVEQPLIQKPQIMQRLDGVEELKEEIFLREELKEALHQINDFERIMSRVIYQTANARDLVSLHNSLENLPLLKDILKRTHTGYLQSIYSNFDVLEDVFQLIDKSIILKDTPFSIREGGIIQENYNSELDMYLNAKREGKNWLTSLEEKEKEETGIKNLKIKYNKVFNYFIEVTKSNINEVPDRYVRKQTLANCERYTTPELDELAELILGSDEKQVELEYQLFCEIRNAIAAEISRIQKCAYYISVIDSLQALAEVAQVNHYIKPLINEEGVIDIKNGRHPVVEKSLSEPFVPNDTYLDMGENQLSIITGPNMAGKSTYMRQTALIVLMAQIGSFVPADSAQISIVDRIFTRVGASDDLTTGQSTFMVEMNEVANILNNATRHSLLILDEIGRGTSTFDGLSIAWAVLEYIANKKMIGAKTLFATHYHELTELEGKLNGVKNYCISVQENGEDIIFLRKIKRGGADHSYGVQVARLAGLPPAVIKRSNEILKQLDAADITKKAKKIAVESKQKVEEAKQIDMFHLEETHMIDEILNLDIMSMSPIEALQKLFELQKKAKGL